MPRAEIHLNSHLQSLFPGTDAFDRILQLEGDIFRHHKHRKTMRIELNGQSYFLKIHRHPGWGEILKNVSRGRIPTITARPEVRAIEKCESLGIPTTPVAGWGARGNNPARIESFLITNALQNMMHLDELTTDWGGLTGSHRHQLQQQVIRDISLIARTLHTHGMNHRDFYLCHFMLPKRDWKLWSPGDPLNLHVIDLHRMQIRRNVPQQWRIKDISGLLFSALDAGLTSRDWLRFLGYYFDQPWRNALRDHRLFLAITRRRAVRLYQSEHGRPAPPPARRASFS